MITAIYARKARGGHRTRDAIVPARERPSCAPSHATPRTEAACAEAVAGTVPARRPAA
jgi:hypothetical protein